MKLRSAPLDDVYQEIQFTLAFNGTRKARLLLWIFRCAYRFLHRAMLLALRIDWPALGQKEYSK